MKHLLIFPTLGLTLSLFMTSGATNPIELDTITSTSIHLREISLLLESISNGLMVFLEWH